MKNRIIILISVLTLISCNQKENVINAGIGGNTTNDLLKRVDDDVINKQPDMVIIMVGTNDMLHSRKMISYEEYKQNIEKIIKKLKSAKIEIVLCSPPTVDSLYLFERNERELGIMAPNIKLDSIARIMKNLSITEKISFVDINGKFRNMNLPAHNIDNYIQNEKNSNVRDGIHPTSTGYNLIAETIYNFLIEHKLIKPKIKVVCFGDSITFGPGVDGEGTSDGDTYPANLKRRLINTFKN